MNRTEDKIQKIVSELDSDAINYVYITDIHYMGITTGQGAALLKQMEQVVSIANNNEEIDLVVLGGDTVQGYWDDKRECFEAYRQILSYLKSCKKPTVILIGNHDDNAYAAWNPNYSQKLISDLDWKREILDPFATSYRVHPEQDPNSKHYYYDLKKGERTIRVFCLDAADNEMEYDKETGIVTKLYFTDGKDEDTPEGSYKYKTGMSVWGYSAEQVKWFADALYSGGFDDALVFSHMGIDAETNGRYIPFGDELRSVIKAYNNKTSYKNEELNIDVDYSDKGKILIYHYGHIHREHKLYSEDISLWQIASSTARADQSAPEDTRELGAETEACYDIVSVKREQIMKRNIGGGSDYRLEATKLY